MHILNIRVLSCVLVLTRINVDVKATVSNADNNVTPSTAAYKEHVTNKAATSLSTVPTSTIGMTGSSTTVALSSSVAKTTSTSTGTIGEGSMNSGTMTTGTDFSPTGTRSSKPSKTEQYDNTGTVTDNPSTDNQTTSHTFVTSTGSYSYTTMQIQKLTFEEIQAILDNNRTVDFLDTFTNALQRQTVRDQLLYCPYTDLCGLSLGLTIPESTIPNCWRCSCEYPKCLGRRECCPDIIEEYYFEHLTGASAEEDILSPVTCTHLHATYLPRVFQYSRYMVSDCPKTTNATLRQLCIQNYTADSVQSFSNILPVTDAVTGDVFRNMFCALCQGVNAYNSPAWKLGLECSNTITQLDRIQAETAIFQHIFNSQTCDLVFHDSEWVENNYEGQCLPAINMCNYTGLWLQYDPLLERQCHLYSSVVRTDGSDYRFRNVFCLLCNGLTPQDTVWKEDENGFNGGLSFSFSGLLRTRSQTFTTNRKDSNPTLCDDDDELFDPLEAKCISVHCSRLYKMSTNGVCSPMFDSLMPTLYIAYIRMIPTQPVTLATVHSITWDVTQWLQSQDMFATDGLDPRYRSWFCSMHVAYTLEGKARDMETLTLPTQLVSYMDIRLVMNVPTIHDPYLVTQYLSAINTDKINISALHDDFEFTVHTLDTVSTDFDVIQGLSLAMQTREIVDDISTPVGVDHLKPYALENSRGNIKVPYLNYTRHDIACFSSTTNSVKASAIKACPLVNISLENLQWNEVLHGIFIVDWKRSLLFTEFVFGRNNNIWICSDTYTKLFANVTVKVTVTTAVMSSTWTTEDVLSLVFTILSMVCLLTTLLTFRLHSSLLTYPAKNTVSLSTCLFLAQLLYLISSSAVFPSGSIPCIVVGACLHFFWLMAIFWMHVCTYHMFQALTTTQLSSQNAGKKFILYHLYCCCMSALLVGVTMAVSYVSTGDSSLGYGATVCYISTGLMLTYTFLLPTAVVIVTNICMFLMVIIRLKRMPNIQKTVQNERNDLIIFVKLSSLTGITWIFGFLFSLTDQVVFSYLFIVSSCSMGVFIFLSFVANRRIFKMYKEKYSTESLATSNL